MSEPFASRLSGEEAADLAAQIAALAGSGLPLAPGLRAAADELRGSRVATVLDRVASDLDAGMGLDEAIAAQSERFPKYLRRLILAGVKSGRLAVVLQQFVATERSRSELRRRIWANLAYPAALLAVMIVLMGLCAHWMLPAVESILADFHQPGEQALPALALIRVFFWLTGGLLSAGLLLWGLARLGMPGAWIQVVDSIPILGPIWRWSRFVAFCRLMEVLVRESVPMPEALRITSEAMREPRLAWACREAASRVESGAGLSQTLARLRPLPPSLLPFVEWGEATNHLAEGFAAAAESLEGRIQSQVALLEHIAMPATFLLIIGMAGVLGSSYALPLLRAIPMLSGGSMGTTGSPGALAAGFAPIGLLGGLGPLVLGLAVLLSLRVLSDPKGRAVRDLTQQALFVIGVTLAVVGALGTLRLWLGIVVVVVAVIVAILALIRLRRTQQYALLSLMAAAAQRLMPLVPTMEAFGWEYRTSTGRRASRLADLLRSGQPLPASLKQCRGLLPRAAAPLVYTGYESGALAASLHEATRARNEHEPMVSEVCARIAYLAGVILFFQPIFLFMMLKITPSMAKIFADFGMSLPEPTQVMVEIAWMMNDFAVLLWLPLIAGLVLVYALLRYSGLVPWRLPGTSWFVRKLDRATVLDALSVAADRRRPMLDALHTLANSFPERPIRKRLQKTEADVEAGMPWSESLYRHGLLGKADLAVLEAAARVGNLAWAMREMADSNRRRWVYRARMWLQALFPLALLCIGAAIALYAIGYFLPLVRLIESFP